MTTWLLTHVSAWVLVAVIVGGMICVAVLGCFLVRRLFPALTEGVYSDVSSLLIGIFAAIYGVLLAFVIVILWENRSKAANAVDEDAAALRKVVQDSQALPGQQSAAISDSVKVYVHAVIGEEWPSMAKGTSSTEAVDAMGRLLHTVQAQQPATNTQGIFYSDAVASLNQAIANRPDRLAASTAGLPTLLPLLVTIGAFVFVPLTYLFGIHSLRAHLLFVGTCAAMVAVGLLLVVVLARPFAGPAALDPGPFRQGTLAQV